MYLYISLYILWRNGCVNFSTSCGSIKEAKQWACMLVPVPFTQGGVVSKLAQIVPESYTHWTTWLQCVTIITINKHWSLGLGARDRGTVKTGSAETQSQTRYWFWFHRICWQRYKYSIFLRSSSTSRYIIPVTALILPSPKELNGLPSAWLGFCCQTKELC